MFAWDEQVVDEAVLRAVDVRQVRGDHLRPASGCRREVLLVRRGRRYS